MSTASNRGSVGGNQRYRKGLACPICGGSEDDDRGTGSRCFGYLGGDGLYAHCSREEKAGGLTQHSRSQTFAHRLKGECRCGIEHGQADLAPKVRRRSGTVRKTIVAEYDYVDEAGNLLFQAIRYNNKTFSQRRPSGIAGTWHYDLKGVRRVLYRLPELAAADPSAPVFLVEGEKDVDALRALGRIATCNPMGAGKWKDDYSPTLAGRVAWIVADNDKAGRDHAESVARSLSGIAKVVKMLDLAQACRDLGLGELAERGDASDFLGMGGTVEDLARIFGKAPAWKPFKVIPEGGIAAGGEPPERTPIEVNTLRHEVLEKTLEALAADPEIYRRGPFLVKVVREKREAVSLTPRSIMKNLAGSPKIIALADQVIGTRLTKFAEFYQWKRTNGGEENAVPAHPPDWLIKAVATLEYWPQIRRLMSVVECPFPRPDGSIVETPGYDRDTSTLFLPACDFPKVPSRPTQDDARAAWGRLSRYVRQFPFATEDDRVVYLAGMLNVIGRPAIEGPVMGVVVNGNKAATGKGLLIDAMTIPGIGRPAPTTSYPDGKEEANKVKVAIVLSGKPVVNFDNLDEGSTYGGGVMDSALTSYSIDERILGASKNTGDLEVRTTWFINGNNINPAKDAYRRWMVANLVTELEAPENREDLEDKNLRKRIIEDRGEIIRDALTILRAHAIADWPNGGWSPKGSFEEWDRVVRGAVWFATGRDCLATQQRAAEESPERREKISLLEGLYELPGGKLGESGLTSSEVVSTVEGSPGRFQILRNYLMQKGRGGKLASSGTLGNLLRGLKNTPIGGLKLREVGDRKHAVCWAVEQIEDGESGESGESVFGLCTQKSNTDHGIITNRVSSETRYKEPNRHSPDSPDSPENHRSIIATWKIEWREKHGVLANQLAEEGYAWPTDEIEAFARISAEMDKSGPLTGDA